MNAKYANKKTKALMVCSAPQAHKQIIPVYLRSFAVNSFSF